MYAMQTQTKSILASLNSFKYEECHKNFTFDTYVLKHIKQHNLHNELIEHDADPISESMKIHYFQTRIVTTAFDSIKNALLADPDKFQTFDRVKDMFYELSSLKTQTRRTSTNSCCCIHSWARCRTWWTQRTRGPRERPRPQFEIFRLLP
jgi:hypothetical protein